MKNEKMTYLEEKNFIDKAKMKIIVQKSISRAKKELCTNNKR